MLRLNPLESCARLARTILAGREARFVFQRAAVMPTKAHRRTSLYVHVPFCRQLCPYCPYNRVQYDSELASKYLAAMQTEMRCYAELLRNTEVTSVYFGGGTPTVLGPQLKVLAAALRACFNITGPFCLETNPADLDQKKAFVLREIGAEAVSLGVQSFDPNSLRTIGRQYDAKQVDAAINWLLDAGIPVLNVDLMFALPGQTRLAFRNDVDRAVSCGADQITAYPLFTFSYSSVGRYRRLRGLKMPPVCTRRRMYYDIYDRLTAEGYSRASVWSFKKRPDTARYSSVTREGYVGFGPGAGSNWGNLFTLNTFDVSAYVDSVNSRGHALALQMPIPKRLAILHDFYWRLYDTCIPKTRDLEAAKYVVDDVPWLRRIVWLARRLGLMTDEGSHYALTKSGAFWVHLMQNQFSLRYIDRIWTKARADAWPESIVF